MVTTSKASKNLSNHSANQMDSTFSVINSTEISNSDLRLDAGYYNLAFKKAIDKVLNCKSSSLPLFGPNGFSNSTFNLPRFKRVFVEKGIPIYTASQILDLIPVEEKFISPKTKVNLDKLRLRKNQILMTCSGTVGELSVVNKTLENKVFSHDVIRITCNDESDTGYVYAILKTSYLNQILKHNRYGSVVTHLEPEHLKTVPIPNPPRQVKKEISDKIMKSYALRDEVVDLFLKSRELVLKMLKLPPIEDLMPSYIDSKALYRSFERNARLVSNRLDAEFHDPMYELIKRKILDSSDSVLRLGDSEVIENIELPERFKRVYSTENQGKVFLSGRNITQFEPTNVKYVSGFYHKERILKQLLLRENTILVTRSGTIGKVVITPMHFNKWTADDDIIRITPSKSIDSGYLYAFLSSEYGHALIRRVSFGSVVEHISITDLVELPIPIISIEDQRSVGKIVRDAQNKWSESYFTEREIVSDIEARINDGTL